MSFSGLRFTAAGSAVNHWDNRGWICTDPDHPHPLSKTVYGPDSNWFDRHNAEYHRPKEENMEVAVDRPIYLDLDKPETSKWYAGEERMSAAEWLRRTVGPGMMPVVEELGDVRSTMARFGQIARSKGTSRRYQLAVVRLYSPDYPSGVNGWTDAVWAEAWAAMSNRYTIEWDYTPPKPVEVPQVPAMAPYAPALQRLLMDVVESRRPSYRSDPQWQAAKQTLDRDPRERLLGESPEERLIRRQSASALMFAIEKEHEGR